MVTTHYYLGGRQVAFKKGDDLEYLHQDHLGSTSVTSGSDGAEVSRVKYFPFGGIRAQTGETGTDKLFTGQRLDETGLYYYNARYYDAEIGRFISADPVMSDMTNPQKVNPYSYCNNNPTVYVDPFGLDEYVIVGGSNSTTHDLEDWSKLLYEAGFGHEEDRVYFLKDVDPESAKGGVGGWDVQPRLRQLIVLLAMLHQYSGDDIHLFGFSEGASAIGALLNWAASSGETPVAGAQQIRTAVLLEPVTGVIQQELIAGFENAFLDNLPARLKKHEQYRDIRLAFIWNKASYACMYRPEGWGDRVHGYDSRPWWKQATAMMGQWGYGLSLIERGLGFGDYHNHVKESDTVIGWVRKTMKGKYQD